MYLQIYNKLLNIAPNLTRIITSHRYMIFIFTVLVIELFSNMPEIPSRMSTYIISPYLVSYEFGIGPRMLIGSIINLFIDYIPSYFIWVLTVITILILCLLVSFLLEIVIKKTDKKLIFIVMFLIAIYILCPASISYLFYYEDFGRFDLYLLLLTLISVLLLKNKYSAMLIPIICITCMAIHQIYLCTFAPLIVILLIYNVYKHNYSKFWIGLLIATLLSISISFIYFQFLSGINIQNIDELVSILQSKANFEVDSGSLYASFFETTSEHLSTHFPTANRIIGGVVALILLSPLFILFYNIWKRCIDTSNDNKSKWIYHIFLISPLAAIPAFIIAIDWGRWIAGIIIVQFSILFYLIYCKDENLLNSLSKISQLINNKYSIIFGLLIYLSALGRVREVIILQVEKYWYYLPHLQDNLNQLLPYIPESLHNILIVFLG